jgi:hypothetical protein
LKATGVAAERSPSSGLLLHREEHNAGRVCVRAHRDGRRGESSPAEAILAQRQVAACPWATAELDASACARLDVAEDASPELRHRPDAGVGKLAAPVPDGREPDARSLPLELSVRLASQAPGTQDEVRYEEQSCAETAVAGAAAQLGPLVSRLLGPVAQLAKPPQKVDSQLGPQEVSRPAGSRDVAEPASLVVSQLKVAPGRPAAGRKMSALQ